MPALTKEQWSQLAAELKSGVPLSAVSRKYGVSRSAIYRKKSLSLTTTPQEKPIPAPPPDRDLEDKSVASLKAEAEELQDRLDFESNVGAVVAATKASMHPEELTDDDRLNEVQRRHKAEPNAIRERLYRALKDHKNATSIAAKKVAFEDMKAAKIASEVMLNLHKMERQAWGFDFTEASGGAGGGGIHLHVQYVERPYDNEKVIEGETT